MNRKTIRFDHPQIPFEEFNILPPPPPAAEMRDAAADGPAKVISYISFGSGSSGNSCYIGNSREGFLIDAGIRADDIVDTLRANGISISRVKGILLTHDHSDHVKYAYTLLRAHRSSAPTACSTACCAATASLAISRTIMSPSSRRYPSPSATSE